MQWNSQLYDEKHQFVSAYGEGVVTLLAPKREENILDLGCGTGDLANKLYNLGAHVIGVDHSVSMIDEANQKYPHISFLVKDAVHLDYKHEFDAVFSNAVLHWIKQPEQVLLNVYKSLKKGGRFVAEFGGQDNVKKITDQIVIELEELGYPMGKDDFPWYFPSIGEYTTLMEKAGFRVVYAEHIDRPTRLEGPNGLINFLVMFADVFFNGVSDGDKKTVLQKVEKELKNDLFHDDHWIADYKRIRVMGIKD